MAKLAPLDAWLARLCDLVPGASAALLVAGKSEHGPFGALAKRPAESAAHDNLLAAAQMAAASGRPVLRGAAEGPSGPVIAAPAELPGTTRSAVALALSPRPDPQLLAALQTLQSGVAWLPALLDQSAGRSEGRSASFVREALDLVAACLDHAEFRAAATAVASELATRHRCERVSLGFVAGHELRVMAVSHSARFDERSHLIRDIAAAMAEAVDQEAVVLDPPAPDGAGLARRAHETLREHGTGAACTLPIASCGEIIGAVTFEAPARGRIEPGLVARARPAIDLVGPILLGKLEAERSIGALIVDAARDRLDALRDPRHPGRKLALGVATGALLLLAIVPAPYRVSAPAHLEGIVQRAIVAPTDGFLTESRARAGDVVKKGQVLGALDASELALERRKWVARREQHTRELRAAMAVHDGSRIPALRAQVEQAEAEVALQDELLKRTELVAPFDGIVARGDWTQSLGAPVARGDVLFEVAPLDRYRVILEVDERDIADVRPGSKGVLTLSALPSESSSLVVERITPVATAEDSRNFFRVEARLEGDATALRPGMEGVGKIHAGWRRILWIGSHSIFDWLRLWLWARLP